MLAETKKHNDLLYYIQYKLKICMQFNKNACYNLFIINKEADALIYIYTLIYLLSIIKYITSYYLLYYNLQFSTQ